MISNNASPRQKKCHLAFCQLPDRIFRVKKKEKPFNISIISGCRPKKQNMEEGTDYFFNAH